MCFIFRTALGCTLIQERDWVQQLNKDRRLFYQNKTQFTTDTFKMRKALLSV